MNLRLLPFLGLLCIQATLAWPLSAQDNQIDYYLSSLFDNHNKIKSGVFYVQGSFDGIAESDQRVEGPVEMFCAFDFEKNLMRLDITRPIQLKKNDEYERTVRKTVFARTENYVVFWDNRNEIAFIRPRDTDYGEVSFFDVRSLGLMNRPTFRYLLKQGEYDWRRFCSEFRKKSLVLEKTDDGIVLSEDDAPTLTIRELLLAGTGIPFPRQFVVSMKSGNSKSALDTTDLEWKVINGVAVPVSYVHSDRDSKTKYFFEWESLNEGIPNHYFDIEEFGLAPQTPIVDERTDPPRALGKIGQTKIPYVEVRKSRGIGFWIGVIATVLCASLFAFALWKRRQ